ncbi:lasso peptide biosynthesis B2 protein [Aurantiacibacter poecillastricola]|uniref:lasso peptide biosynthesis B2 protein n=1 Tax=Aurantiacibacter poecillastricola TaxID=3064385 RepID=UPI00273ED2E5|nr:lasso peptide biosynthesis B2 protein [Aurantiacibacter sp. 219JJ12-13]MDP5260725.1 lasso peptide biosynthesis B2 protein [Aurantiacibacter sp. 219JJ12-13]
MNNRILETNARSTFVDEGPDAAAGPSVAAARYAAAHAGRRNRIGLLLPALRALVELGAARLRHSRFHVRDIERLNRDAAARGRSAMEAAPKDFDIAARIAYVIPRVARRLPFRSDCVPQAMAGQRWLLSKGIASTIVIGVDLPGDKIFNAHAWLQYGGSAIIGGNVTRFSPLFGTDDDERRRIREVREP